MKQKSDVKNLYNSLQSYINQGCNGCNNCVSNKDICMMIVELKIKLKQVMKEGQDEVQNTQS